MKPKPSSIDISDSEDDLDSFPVTEIKPLGTTTKPAKGKKIGPKSRVQKKTTAKKDIKAKTTKAPKKANTEEEDMEEAELRSADNNDGAEKDGNVRSRMNLYRNWRLNACTRNKQNPLQKEEALHQYHPQRKPGT